MRSGHLCPYAADAAAAGLSEAHTDVPPWLKKRGTGGRMPGKQADMHEKEAKSILTTQNGMNHYRGCETGCIYCDAGLSGGRMTHDFSDVEIKPNAPELLESALRRKRSKCMITTGAAGEPYPAAEAERELTRRCLEVIDRYGFGLSVQTKSDLILRDLPLLESINRKSRCIVQIQLTAADPELSGKLEPGAASPARRAEVLYAMRDAGIPTVVCVTPILPFINDTMENASAIMEYCVRAEIYGLQTTGSGFVLKKGGRPAFEKMLDERFPGMKERYRETFQDEEEFISPNAGKVLSYMRTTCESFHIENDPARLFTWLHAFRDRQAGEQLNLFDFFGSSL